jgi:hypothetical protein
MFQLILNAERIEAIVKITQENTLGMSHQLHNHFSLAPARIECGIKEAAQLSCLTKSDPA